jgi:hypothetical protein
MMFNKTKLRLASLLFVCALATTASAVPTQKPVPQAGASQGGPTSDTDTVPGFNKDYFTGEWKFKGTVSESPLGEGGELSGSETVRNGLDGRFWDVTINGQDSNGTPFTGKGIIIFQDSFFGQFFMRYEVTQGIALLRMGSLGCDLGGTCSVYYETPPFEHNGSTIQLKGRYYLTGRFAYRLTTQIAVDKGEYRNLGTLLYTKDEKAKSPMPIR